MPLPNCLATSLTLGLALTAHADEGMWVPSNRRN